eukprot:31497-Pelagococcus_subviridis.AAC.14
MPPPNVSNRRTFQSHKFLASPAARARLKCLLTFGDGGGGAAGRRGGGGRDLGSWRARRRRAKSLSPPSRRRSRRQIPGEVPPFNLNTSPLRSPVPVRANEHDLARDVQALVRHQVSILRPRSLVADDLEHLAAVREERDLVP